MITFPFITHVLDFVFNENVDSIFKWSLKIQPSNTLFILDTDSQIKLIFCVFSYNTVTSFSSSLSFITSDSLHLSLIVLFLSIFDSLIDFWFMFPSISIPFSLNAIIFEYLSISDFSLSKLSLSDSELNETFSIFLFSSNNTCFLFQHYLSLPHWYIL